MRAPPLRDRLDKAMLEKLYHHDGLTAVQIANRYGTFSSSVLKLMQEYEIPRRPPLVRAPGNARRRAL
jgi:hypothetical protein